MQQANKIYVTQPLLPKLEDLFNVLQSAWKKKIVTNCGPLHTELENQIKKYFDTEYVLLINNGMLALCIALKAADLSGEVITTPFTFAATPHALSWCNLRPVFCDIEPHTLNIDPDKIEPLITSETSAILATHVYGNPCHVKAIENIANRYNLKVVYDAAHAFSTHLNGVSIANFGDLSAFSFHATKLFNTIEGGCLVCHKPETYERAKLFRNFGKDLSDEHILLEGTNGKLSELHSAVGLLNLELIENERKKRHRVQQIYHNLLLTVEGIEIVPLADNVTKPALLYFPIRVKEKIYGHNRDELIEFLKEHNIFAKRYFYPLCSHYPHYAHLPSANSTNLSVAEKVAQEIMCLPFYGSLEENEVDQICQLIKKFKT